MSPDPHEAMVQQLLRGTVDEGLDLSDAVAVDAYLIRKGFRGEQVFTRTEADLDEVRRRLQRRVSLLDRIDAGLDRISESGALPFLFAGAIGLAGLYVWQALDGEARAATIVAAPPRSSTLAGILVALVPIGIAWLFAGIALHGTPPMEDEATGGDAATPREKRP